MIESRSDISQLIVDAILRNLSGRSGLDIEEIINDEDIYAELVEDLFNTVDNILSREI